MHVNRARRGGLSVIRGLVLVAFAVQLVACGGGGTSATPAPTPSASPPQPTSQDLANAKAAALSASLDLSSNMATLTWIDTFPTATGYEIDQEGDGGVWTVLETIPGQQGTQKTITWSR